MGTICCITIARDRPDRTRARSAPRRRAGRARARRAEPSPRQARGRIFYVISEHHLVMSQVCTLTATGESLEVPAWTRIKQSFDRTSIADVPAAVKEAMVCTLFPVISFSSAAAARA